MSDQAASGDVDRAGRIQVSGIDVQWDVGSGCCTFEKLPVTMMWVDTTLAGLMSGVQAMVGTERYLLALQSEGRKSVEEDWRVIAQFPDFREGFKAIANIAAVAGWGRWTLTSLHERDRECRFRVTDSWEGRYQKALGVCWGSGMLAGKMAGYCSKLFATNCWADQTAFLARGDPYDEFVVRPSPRLIEREIESLLASDEATRADMAVALRKLEREVAERRRMEEEIRRLNVDLEWRVQDRTARLRAANHELEAFAYSVSHDLRAPLRAIGGYSGALLEDCAEQLDAEGRGHLDRIVAAVARMDRLIDDLLRLSRITRTEMQRQQVNLAELARSLIAELRAGEPDRAVEFVGVTEATVSADPDLMRIAVGNLLHNAWKFTGHQREARIEFGTVMKGMEQVYLVRDNGAGFDMAYADKLFGVFQRLHGPHEFPGTGIGLATVQRIVRRHGGRVWAEGVLHEGATFYFTLPSGEGSFEE